MKKIEHEKIKAMKKEDGYTLLEVIISMAILGIIIISIVTIFSNSFINIFSFGNRSQALTMASQKLEVLYTLPIEKRNLDVIKMQLEEQGGVFVANKANLYENPNGDNFRFIVENKKLAESPISQISGYEITTVVYYRNGKSNVTLKTFLRGGGA